MREVWSRRYGPNPKEGLQMWLERNVKGYKRQDLTKYLTGFAAYLGKPEQKEDHGLADRNFKKWTTFVREQLKQSI